MMILCKWRKGHDTEGQNFDDGELKCDEVSLNDQDLNWEENEFQPDISCKSQSLVEVKIKKVTSIEPGKGFPANDLTKTSLILDTADLELNLEKLELYTLESVSSDAKKDRGRNIFLHSLDEFFFTSLICGSRSILTLDSDVTISAIRKLSCEIAEEDMTNRRRLIISCIDSLNENKTLENINLRKISEAFTHQQYSLTKANSLPRIKLKDFEAKINVAKESDILIAYPEVQSTEEQVKQYEAPTLCSEMLFNRMKANDYFDKDESDVSGTDFPQIGKKERELGNILRVRNKGWEKFCFPTQIPKAYSHFYYKTNTNIEELFTNNQR